MIWLVYKSLLRMKEEEKISLLDQVLVALDKEGTGTVPELLDGFEKYPANNSQKEKEYKIIEGELVKFKLVKILEGGDNSIPYGYFRFEILPLGVDMVMNGISVARLYLNEQQREKLNNSNYNLSVGNNSTTNLIFNSPNASITNKSEVVHKIKYIINTIENDTSVDDQTKQQAIDNLNVLASEIEDNKVSQNSKSKILAIGADIASVGSMIISLIQLLPS